MQIWNFSSINWPDRKKEIINLICNEEYGYLPPNPVKLTWTVLEEDDCFCAGKVVLKKVLLKADFESESFSFPIYTSIPNNKNKHPFFVHINFRDNVPDKYMPVEEICDNGFAVLSFCYKDVTSDDNDFTNGLSGVINDVNLDKNMAAVKLPCGHGQHHELWIMHKQSQTLIYQKPRL